MNRAQKLTALAGLLAAPSLFSSGTTAWEMTSYGDFIRGRFDGVSLSREGRLSLAPKVETVFTSDQPVIWSMAQGIGGTLYAATGHRGRVYQIDATGKASLVWTSDQPEVFALAVDRSGILYAGTSPDGKVYRIENGKATEYFAPKARYIWSLAVAADGALYVGTGDHGQIYRVTAAGQGEVWYETSQSHITGLAIDSEGRLLAGTEPNGILYRITAKDKAFVLYDANLPEIRAIVPMTDGTVYAAALGGSVARRAQAAQGAQNPTTSIPTISTTITVEAAAGDLKAPEVKPTPVPQTPPVAAQPTQVVDVSGVEKSAVYRINPDNTVETLWSSKDENAYDLLALERQLLFATDTGGRVYGLSPDRRITLVAQTNESETTRLLPSEHSVLLSTGNLGRIYRLGEKPGAAGSYEAPPHDSGTASRWGSLSWKADLPAGCTVAFRTRSGNSARPDRTWSDWSAPVTDPAGSRITSPNSRYIQWKAEMTGTGGATPLVNSVTLAYLPQNSPPVIKSINVSMQAVSSQAAAKTVASTSTAAYSVTVSDTGDVSSSTAGTATQTLSRASLQQFTVSWTADDPDGDRLVYNLYFRPEDGTQWMMLRSALHETSITFDADILADGKYFFRVLASDRESNAPASARDAQLISPPVMIDNTPPAVSVGAMRYAAGAAHVEFEAADASSALRRAEYSLDAGSWVPVDPVDGVIDSLRERFVLDLSGLAPGEHLLVIRAADSAGNTGLAKVVLK